MDDSGARLPEPDAIFRCHAFQKVVNLSVRIACGRQILLHSLICLNQMIAMHGRGHSHLLLSCIHELQQGHLRRSVLHRHPVGTKIHIIFSPAECSHRLFIIQMCIQDLFGQSHRPIQFLSGIFHFRPIRRVEVSDHFNVVNHTDYPFIVFTNIANIAKQNQTSIPYGIKTSIRSYF